MSLISIIRKASPKKRRKRGKRKNTAQQNASGKRWCQKWAFSPLMDPIYENFMSQVKYPDPGVIFECKDLAPDLWFFMKIGIRIMIGIRFFDAVISGEIPFVININPGKKGPRKYKVI